MQTTSKVGHTPVIQDVEDSVSFVAGIRIELEISDPESASALISHPQGRQRDEFIRQALRIGVLSLRQAQGVVDGDKIRNEGERLLTELATRLAHFQQVTETKLSATLKEYFDPQDGRMTERIERLVKNDGELERVMRECVFR